MSIALGGLLGLLLAALGVFIARGPVQGLRDPSDFVVVYGPARTWLTGGNPYDQQQVDEAWERAGAPFELRPSSRTKPGLIYPPTTLVMLAPFSVLPWRAAHLLWMVANVAFLAIVIWSIAWMAGFQADQLRTWLFVLAALLFAPVHTTFRHGQTPLYCLALLLPAMVGRARPGGGALLGCAALLKPQLAGPFVLLEFLRGRFRMMGAVIGVIGLVCVIAIAPMSARGVPWWSSWRHNVSEFTGAGAGDPTAANINRHQLLNLIYPVTALIETGPGSAASARIVAQVVSLIIVAALAWVFFLSPATAVRRMRLLTSASMVAVLTLMVVYHRFYDGVVLLLPLAWAIDAIARHRDRLGAIVLALLAPFFFNSATGLYLLAERGRLPNALVEGWWWQRLILPHQGWAILGIAICLLMAKRRGFEQPMSPTISSMRPAMRFGAR